MAYNHGQDLAMVDLKLTTQALTKRLLWSLVIGLIVIGVCVMLGPRDMVVNVLWYLKAQAFLEVRRLPIFGVRRQDIYELVKPLYLMRRQADSWLFSLELGAGASAVSFGLFTYFFWRRGQRSLTEQCGGSIENCHQRTWVDALSWGRKNSSFQSRFSTFTLPLLAPAAPANQPPSARSWLRL